MRIGRGGGDGGAEFGRCNGKLLATLPAKGSVTIVGNVLTGLGVHADDPIVLPPTGGSQLTLASQLAALEAKKTGVFIDAERIASSVDIGQNTRAVGASIDAALMAWRARCEGRGFQLARYTCDQPPISKED